MRAVNIHGAGDVRVDEVPEPVLGARDVLLKIEACGICGSDLTFAKLGFQREDGAVWPLGHEAAGTVVAVGDAVEGIPVGMRAVVNPMGAHDNVIGNGGSEGAFADYLLIRDAMPGQHLLPIPAHLSAERAALVEPLAVALHGVNQAKLQPDEQVVVYGAGPIGLGAIFWLKRRGFANVVSVDLSDARLGHARKLGVDHVVNPGKSDLKARLTEIHGEAPVMFGAPTIGTDVFLDMAGAVPLLEQTITMGKYQSRIVLTAVYPMPVPLDLQGLLIREISLTPAVGYPTELAEVLAVLETVSDAEIAPYVSHRFSFDSFPSALDAAKDPASAKVMVLF
jgi:(R,R)-butanediol dehydrogenase/meso-butanediol dehydrogenase/diacetyl reductase